MSLDTFYWSRCDLLAYLGHISFEWFKSLMYMQRCTPFTILRKFKTKFRFRHFTIWLTIAILPRKWYSKKVKMISSTRTVDELLHYFCFPYLYFLSRVMRYYYYIKCNGIIWREGSNIGHLLPPFVKVSLDLIIPNIGSQCIVNEVSADLFFFLTFSRNFWWIRLWINVIIIFSFFVYSFSYNTPIIITFRFCRFRINGIWERDRENRYVVISGPTNLAITRAL